MSFERDQVVDGRYRILEPLGEGGHGVVFRAVDEMLGSQVAIKVLHESVAQEPGFKTRLMREARAMGALSGTSAVQVMSFGKTPHGGLYIVMEMVVGRTLEAYLREIEAFGGQLSVARLVELLGPIVDTLEAAHAQGIIHRDLKPANIMVLDKLGRGPVRLLDFGLAKDLKAEPLTMEGIVAGSPSYIAPESWLGKSDIIDHRIDVYALGAIVFRALGGEPPFDSRQPIDKLILAVTRGPRPKLRARRPDLPEDVDAWAEQALAIKRDERFPSVRAMWSAFLAVAEQAKVAR
jgi:serine/threonine protein kinase